MTISWIGVSLLSHVRKKFLNSKAAATDKERYLLQCISDILQLLLNSAFGVLSGIHLWKLRDGIFLFIDWCLYVSQEFSVINKRYNPSGDSPAQAFLD